MQPNTTIHAMIPATGWQSCSYSEHDEGGYYAQPLACWAHIETKENGHEIIALVADDYAGTEDPSEMDTFLGLLGPGQDDDFIIARAESYQANLKPKGQ